jgi:TetR/AcrR family transcriptional repressor of nem operon
LIEHGRSFDCRVRFIVGGVKCTVKYIIAKVASMSSLQAVSGGVRPRTPKGQATRTRIIDAASDLVFEGGVAHTSLDDVGSVARVGKSQIYHYFADKSELIGEVVTRQTGDVLGAQEPYLSQLDSWDSWQNWRDGIIRNQQLGRCRGGCPIGSIANELADSDEANRILLVDSFDKWELAFRDGVTRMQANGLVSRDADPDLLAAAILAALQGGLLLCKTRKSTAPLEAALDAAIGFLHSADR